LAASGAEINRTAGRPWYVIWSSETFRGTNWPRFCALPGNARGNAKSEATSTAFLRGRWFTAMADAIGWPSPDLQISDRLWSIADVVEQALFDFGTAMFEAEHRPPLQQLVE
jgi:hypothetical protein